VTGNLYVPKSGKGHLPAIIAPCGHYPLAQMVPQYQFAYLNLVHNGFVVLAYDPIGQGERRQYWNPYNDITEVGDAVFEHSMPGQLLLLLGESLSQYRISDGMRAIDYLLTRPEVDSERIGCAGHSGGGTLTLFLSALDERVRCSVIHEGGTGNRWPVHVEPFSALDIPDIEQNLFPAAIYGIDNADLHTAIAPRPLLASIEHSSAGFEAATGRIRRGYRQLNATANFTTVQADDPHAWTFKLRIATADWFSRWFYGRPGPV
jgi:dienelactone hydrolase